MVAGDLKAHLRAKRVRKTDEVRGKKGNALEVDVLAVADTTLDTSTLVGLGTELAIGLLDEGVVVQRTSDLGSLESGSDLETLGRGNGEHGVGELGLELVEDGLTESNGAAADDAGDVTTDRIRVRLGLDNALQEEVGQHRLEKVKERQYAPPPSSQRSPGEGIVRSSRRPARE